MSSEGLGCVADTVPLLSSLAGVGPKQGERLACLGLHTLADILLHLPLRYQDRSRLVALSVLRHGQEVLVRGQVDRVQSGVGPKRALVVDIEAAGARLSLRFIHHHPGLSSRFSRGQYLQCFGLVRQNSFGVEMVHPEYQGFDPECPPVLDGTLTPIYSTVVGLHQTILRRLIDQALAWLQGEGADVFCSLVPEAVFGRPAWPSLVEAIPFLHCPPSGVSGEALLEGGHPARLRLACEELVAHQLACRELRRQTAHWQAPLLLSDKTLWQRFMDQLSFTLTQAQQRVIGEISGDLCRPRPMQRLLQGDVGSGKTVVAAAAIIHAVAAGYQVAVMAPTELLAEQHLQSFRHWLLPLGISVGWLSGCQSTAQRRETLTGLARSDMAVVIGTHALFQDSVVFARLGLVVIDEQHRFGVHQRLALLEKGRGQGLSPHLLIMTATPIPRTLMMTAYADLDCSIIDERPPGRKPVETVVLSDVRRLDVLGRVEHACSAGRQVYWVCTLIESSEVLQCQAAEDVAHELSEALEGVRVSLLHGRMDGDEKARVMAQFRAGHIDILVATTVIEVGVDVPNASVMVIENAERLGLSQLHQLRGRIGRGSEQGFCVLMYHVPLSGQGKARLSVMRDTQDGFEIARQDMALRGPGELLGTRQAGYVRFRIADLLRDQFLVPHAAGVVRRIEAEFAEVIPAMIERWLGDAVRYRDS